MLEKRLDNISGPAPNYFVDRLSLPSIILLLIIVEIIEPLKSWKNEIYFKLICKSANKWINML